ncbi:MAG: hypothetical protein JRI66_12235 [Deltaproteobacteria bacterium]|nr:hypothetical protein [Deltaproteobacteria bacterium]
MGWFLSLIFSKLGAILAGALAILGLLLKGRWDRYQAEKAAARAKTAEAKLEMEKVEREYEPEIKEVEEAGQESDADRIADLINRRWGMWNGKTKPD